MEWRDEGLILGCRKHGEGSVIVEIMTPTRGRTMGLVRGGRSSRMRALLQPGNSVFAHWRARLEEHLGTFTLDADRLRAASLMEMPLGIYGLQTLAHHLRLLPERDPHAGLYHAALVVLDHLDEPEIASQLLIRFEVAMLEELGFGLDLSECAATGERSDLVYVSPKSGRAVSAAAGKPYHEKMLALPPFLAEGRGGGADAGAVTDQVSGTHVPSMTGAEHTGTRFDIESGFLLTRFFLDRHVYQVRGVRPPDERAGFIKSALRLIADTQSNPKVIQETAP